MNYKFNVGDRVRFIGYPSDYAYMRRTIILEKGDVGTVREKSLVPYVLFDKCPDKEIAVIQDNLELVPVNSTFRVGDRVRMKYSNYYTNSWHLNKGTVGTVVAIRNINSYTVRFDNWHHGHDGDIGVSDHSCLYLSEGELEPIKFVVGDTVKFARKSRIYTNFPIGTVAKVIATDSDVDSAGWDCIVQLVGEKYGWTHVDKKGNYIHNCQYADFNDLALFPVEEQTGAKPVGQTISSEQKKKEKFKLNIVIYRKGNKVIAQLNNGKCVYAVAEAKCSPNDTFNFAIGSQIALQRLCRKMGTNGNSAIVIPEDLRLNELFMY